MIAKGCLEIISQDPNVGIVALSSSLTSGRELAHAYRRVLEATAAATSKPVVLIAHLSSAVDRVQAARLRAKGIPVLPGTHCAIRALRRTADWGRWLSVRKPRGFDSPTGQTLKEEWRKRLKDRVGALDTADGLDLLSDHGVSVVAGRTVTSEAEALRCAAEIGYPLVAKTLAEGIEHKFDVGGVKLGISSDDELRKDYRELHFRLGPKVLLQAYAPPGAEIILGMTVDEKFGPILTVGMGGIYVEIFRDFQCIVPPVTCEDAVDALKKLRCFRLLDGARGGAHADIPALARLIASFSGLVSDLPGNVLSIEANPVIAGAEGAFAVDALILFRSDDHEALQCQQRE